MSQSPNQPLLTFANRLDDITRALDDLRREMLRVIEGNHNNNNNGRRNIRGREASPERSVRRARRETAQPTLTPASSSPASILTPLRLKAAPAYHPYEGIISLVLWVTRFKSEADLRLEMRVEVYWRNSPTQDDRLLKRADLNDRATQLETDTFRERVREMIRASPPISDSPFTSFRRPGAGTIRILFTEQTLIDLGFSLAEFPDFRSNILPASHPCWSLSTDWHPIGAPTPMQTFPLSSRSSSAAISPVAVPPAHDQRMAIAAASSSSSSSSSVLDLTLPDLPIISVPNFSSEPPDSIIPNDS